VNGTYSPHQEIHTVITMSKNSSRGAAWNKMRAMILERDGHSCAYCGQEADTVDHIIPKSSEEDDLDNPGNLVAACRRCNGLKSDKPLIRTNYFNKAWITRL
jgi:5-methylcytosine-specific restriction endonuclease McrA